MVVAYSIRSTRMSHVYKLNFVFNCWISHSAGPLLFLYTIYIALSMAKDCYKPSANVKQDALFYASLDFLLSHSNISSYNVCVCAVDANEFTFRVCCVCQTNEGPS